MVHSRISKQRRTYKNKRQRKNTRKQSVHVKRPIRGGTYYPKYDIYFKNDLKKVIEDDVTSVNDTFSKMNDFLRGNWGLIDNDGNTPLLAIGKLYVESESDSDMKDFYRSLLLYLLDKLNSPAPLSTSITIKHHTGLLGVEDPTLYLENPNNLREDLMSILQEDTPILDEICTRFEEINGCTRGRPSPLFDRSNYKTPTGYYDPNLIMRRNAAVIVWKQKFQAAMRVLKEARVILDNAKQAVDKKKAAIADASRHGKPITSLTKELKNLSNKVVQAAAAIEHAENQVEKVREAARIAGEAPQLRIKFDFLDQKI